MTTDTAVTTENSATSANSNRLLEVENLKMYFPVTSGVFIQRKIADVRAVDDLTFHVERQETLGLVGESGCGNRLRDVRFSSYFAQQTAV